MAHIAFIAYENCLSSSISLPMEMLNAAADANKVFGLDKTFNDSPKIYGNLRKVNCAGGLSLNTENHPRTIQNPDLVILPAIWRNPLTVVRRHKYLLELLKLWHQQGAMLCAVGTSSSFFAEAGLLDQRTATTHWAHFESFQKRYPTVQLQKDFLITRSQNIYCAGSVNAVQDLIIYFIEHLYSNDIARRVEANFSPEVRQSYAKSMFTQGEYSRHSDEDIVRLQHWLNENYQQNISANNMANMLGISVRTLNRRFKLASRQTPQHYLRQIRMEHAKELLKQSNLAIADIAEQTGFNDISHFCSSFKRFTSMPPGDYREAVKSKIFSLAASGSSE